VILTTDAWPKLQKIHNRMPVILKNDNEQAWLNPDLTEPDEIDPLLAPVAASALEVYAISTAVNNPSNDSAGIITKA